MITGIKVTDFTSIYLAIKDGESFETSGRLRGRATASGDYEIYSYDQKIAQISGNTATLSMKKYSATTTKHQKTILAALQHGPWGLATVLTPLA